MFIPPLCDSDGLLLHVSQTTGDVSKPNGHTFYMIVPSL